MKKHWFYGILFLTLSVFAVSCTPDDDEPDDVTTDVREKISGDWKSSENSATYGPSNYFVDISKDTASSTGIKIYNFFNLGIDKVMKGTVSGNTITLSSDPLDGFVFSGNGSIASNYRSISWTYTFFDGNETEQVTGTYTKL